MKISLNVGGSDATSSKAAQERATGRDLAGIKKGDWDCKNNLVRSFLPLLNSLAQKRTSDRTQVNTLVEAGKEGLLQAAKKYKPGSGAESFEIFAIQYIEKAMTRATSGGGGFFARLFGKS